MNNDKLNIEEMIKAETQKALRDIQREKNNETFSQRWKKNQDSTSTKNWTRPNSKAHAWNKISADGKKHFNPFEKPLVIQPRYNLVPHPCNKTKLKSFIASSPARLAVWRAGSRPLTKVALDFISDHAIAKEAVYHEYPQSKVKALGFFEIFSNVDNKRDFLLRPDLGQQLHPESHQAISNKCIMNPDVQIIISDGLSGTSLDVNIEKLYPVLAQTLTQKGYKVGTPMYCKFARVYLQDRVGELVQAKTCVILIGERPGLGTGDGLSAYIIHEPNSKSTHANRNCISNIHPRGLDSAGAANYIEFTITRMFQQKTSGVDLDLN